MVNAMNVSQAWPSQALPSAPRPGARVYTGFFVFREAPFTITPDPEYLFLSETHRAAIEKIRYGIQGRMGFMLLTGEVGTGKTTLCRTLLDRLQGQAHTVYLINPSLSGRELLAGVLDDLGIGYPEEASKKALLDRLNHFLLAQDTERPIVIVIDDAQTMPVETLEDLRLLSNLETDKHKLLQLLLAGQPELLDLVGRPEMRQLRQRVAIHCALDVLSAAEVGGYIERRLFVAGNQGQVRFTPRAQKRIYRESRGIPRMINKICDLALTAAYAANDQVVDTRHLRAALGELVPPGAARNLPGRLTPGRVLRRWKAAMGLGLGLALALALAWGAFHGFPAGRGAGLAAPLAENTSDTRPL
jgi:general secretion pathway protein A